MVVFPYGKTYNRIAWGKNGKRRHLMFCFSDIYFVEATKNGKRNKFEVIGYKGFIKTNLIKSTAVDSEEHGIQRIDFLFLKIICSLKKPKFLFKHNKKYSTD